MRGFTEESIFNRVENDPELLPREVLGEQLAAKVVRTHGATNYGNEVTCVVSTSENNRELFMKVKPAPGLFIMQQNLETPPRWCVRKAGEDDNAYFRESFQTSCRKAGVTFFSVQTDLTCALDHRASTEEERTQQQSSGRYPGAQPARLTQPRCSSGLHKSCSSGEISKPCVGL